MILFFMMKIKLFSYFMVSKKKKSACTACVYFTGITINLKYAGGSEYRHCCQDRLVVLIWLISLKLP